MVILENGLKFIVFFKLLLDGEVYAGAEKLNKLTDIRYPIIKIIREEIPSEIKEYIPGIPIKIFINNQLLCRKKSRLSERDLYKII